MEFEHKSVLLEETVVSLAIKKDGLYVDATLGGAGHALQIGQALSAKGVLIGLDQDTDALEVAKERLSHLECQVHTVHSNFSHLKEVVHTLGYTSIDGIVFDLGISSYQVDTPERGFSYMHDGPLDMRMNQEDDISAKSLINEASKEELERIISTYGEERWAKRIASFIEEARQEKPIERTLELVQIIKNAIPAKARREGPHPAKRTFQALRIAINKELTILDTTYDDAMDLLSQGGRMAVITFHSLEDRITKQKFKDYATGCVCPPEIPICACNHKPIGKLIEKGRPPTAEEVNVNSRARSARLRVIEKI